MILKPLQKQDGLVFTDVKVGYSYKTGKAVPFLNENI
jgi:hypothetical protein